MLDMELRRDPAVPELARPSKQPILVTGAPRSGSTWVGNVLALDQGSGYIYEPFNKKCPPGQCRARFEHAFTYVTPDNEARYLEPLRDTLAWKYSSRAEMRTIRTARDFARMARDLAYFRAMRQRGARVILKDPLALFSSEWIASRFDARVVVVIRHPAAFVASLRAAGWHQVPFEIFLNQPELMENRLAPFRDRIAAAARRELDAVDAGALLWNILHHHIETLSQEHPDWIFVRHEDLARDPGPAFREMFAKLKLDFTDAVRAGLQRYTTPGATFGRLALHHSERRTRRSSSDNISHFRTRLTPDERARIRSATAPLWQQFYTGTDW